MTAARTSRWIAIGVLFVFTVLPIVLVAYRSFSPPSGPTLSFYREAFSRSITLRSLGNTALISILTVIFGSLLAIPSAWLVARTDVPVGSAFRSLLLLPYVIPPYIGAIAWINLLNPTVGWINRLLGSAAFDIYTVPGIVWIDGLFYYTFMFLSCVVAMENADPSFEEAARVCGASPRRVFFSITLPMIRPAMLAGAFLIFAASAASFGVPALVGTPGRIQVLTTQIYGAIKTGGLDGQYLAAALSAPLLIVAVAAAALADRLGDSRRVTSLTGKAAKVSRTRLGAWRWVGFAMLLSVFLAAFLLPVVAIVLTSLMKVAGNFASTNFTLDKYHYVLFERPATERGFINSIGLAFIAATLAVGAGTVLAYWKGHPRMPRSAFLDACVNLPYAAPGTILALGLILLWTRPFPLVNTLWILLIAYFAKYLSFAVKSLAAQVRQVDPTLEEAARMSGAGPTAAFLTIWVPLLRRGMIASWFLIFMPAFSELTMSVLLAGPKTETLGTVLFDLQEYADPPSASVLAVLILALILAAYGLAGWAGSARRVRKA